MRRMTWRVGMVGFALCLLTPSLSQAEEIRLTSIGVRGGVTGGSPIGALETQYFKTYDFMANWSLPWSWYSASGWGVSTRIMGTAGAITASGDTSFVTTLTPGFVFGKQDSWVWLEVGGGGAFLSQHRFANQDMGGHFQFAADLAVRAKVYEGFGVGYWFHHLSDAGFYGRDAHGADFHMIEISYHF